MCLGTSSFFKLTELVLKYLYFVRVLRSGTVPAFGGLYFNVYGDSLFVSGIDRTPRAHGSIRATTLQ